MAPRSLRRAVRPGPFLLLALLPCLACALPGCGSASGARTASAEPFVADFPHDPAGNGGQSLPVPPPAPPRTPVFDADAWVHGRVVPYGGFPSDTFVLGDTVFTNDGDEITDGGAWIVPLDVSGPAPAPSAALLPVSVHAADLVDSHGNPGDAKSPIGFGFFLNDMLIVDPTLGFALVNAGGSDLDPCLSDVVVFDPTTGAIRQVVNLAWRFPVTPGATDSSGARVPGTNFVQSGAEALCFVRTGTGTGRLLVAMTNLLVGAPSWGTIKYGGTLQVYDVTSSMSAPVSPRSTPGLVTETYDVRGYNPSSVDAIVAAGGIARILVTIAGTSVVDATGALVPQTDAHVDAYAFSDFRYLGRFLLGKVGLASGRPALGLDGTGHHVGFFPSAVTGEIYLLRLDGLFDATVDPSRVAVLRGPRNGIPITPEQSGGPGGNITGVGLSPDGRTLVVGGFGDLFALPTPEPGHLYLLSLPADLVTGAGFGTDFVPGATLYGTVAGRTLGPLGLVPNDGGRPDVYVAVSSPFDLSTFLSTGPASLGSLRTFGLVR